MMSMATHGVREQFSESRFRVAAIDTSSDRAGVALFDGRDAMVLAWNAHRNHTVDTLAQLDHLLRLAGLPLHQLDGVAVATGPGSFSALRVGLSIAKGLVFSLNVPLAGIPTTDAMAAHLAWTNQPAIAVMTAGRGRVVWSRYAGATALDGPNNTTVDELRIDAGTSGALVVSEAELPEEHGAIVLPAGARVEQLSRIGWTRLRAGERDDPASLEPIYAHGRRVQEAAPA
jgi:tRNA threonylcarbamoyladenosine biosynthesis protein TsaB